MSDTDVRIRGLSTLALFAIPAVLALAAIWWLAFGEGLHYFERELGQEKRHAELVGAAILPNGPLELKIINHRDSAIIIDRFEVDGSKAFAYIHNQSQLHTEYMEFRYALMSPDGTIVSSKENYSEISFGGPATLGPNEKAELSFEIPADPRAKTVTFEVTQERRR